jgi:di/tricarboxylate transporter
MTLSAFKKEAGEDTEVLGIVNETGGVKKVKNNLRIKAGQILVIKTPPDDVSSILDVFDFSIPKELHSFDDDDLEEIEAMITPGSRLIGRKYEFFLKLAYEELNLLGLWRKGAKYRTRLTRETFKAGDVLLLGVRDLDEEDVTNKIKHLGLMPLMQRELQTIPSRSRLLKGLIFFLVSIVLVAFNILPTAAAFLLCVLGFARIRIIDSNFYRDIDWPIIIMLAAMIPIGTALQTTGLSDVISSSISLLAADMSLFWLLFLILIITMATTDIINNAATAVIMAPISAGIGLELGYAIEPFLMVVAVGASCAFLTPIGHQCNTVVMGPGNYKFTDYWRLGLPLDILIIIVSIPMILFVWT